MRGEDLGHMGTEAQRTDTGGSEEATLGGEVATLDRNGVGDGLGPSREEIFDVLSNGRRRCTLHYLTEHGEEPVNLREVVEYVAEWEHGKPISDVTSQERMCTYSALHQSHLPKLSSVGLIDYDSQRGEIYLEEGARNAKMYLEYEPENDIPWSAYYAGITALSGVLVALVYLGVYPFDGLSMGAVAGIVVVLLAASALLHKYHERVNRFDTSELFDDPSG